MNNTIIKLTPEVPVDMTLAYTEGKPVGRGQMMFSTVDGRVLYVPEAGGREIQRRLNDLRIKVGDRVLIRQSVDYSGAGREVSWEVYRAKVGVGAQADGSFVVPAQPGADVASPAPVPADRIRPGVPNTISTDHHSPLEHSGRSLLMRQEAQMLLDVLASCQAYAKQCYPDITADDVRACVLATYGSKNK